MDVDEVVRQVVEAKKQGKQARALPLPGFEGVSVELREGNVFLRKSRKADRITNTEGGGGQSR